MPFDGRCHITFPCRQTRNEPRGLTTLEFLGCLIAVLGGMYLGAIYLGVDVRHLAYNALDQADMLEKVPADWRPPAPPDKAMTREQLVRTLREELGMLRNELTALQSNTAAGEAAGGTPTAQLIQSLPQPVTKEKTLAYWKRLNEIAMGETALQQDAESTINKTNAARVFAIKGRISRFSAKAVEAIPTPGVDDSVVKFGRQLVLWYDHGGELYERAVRIWETPIGPQARGQINDEWKTAQKHHRNEERLIQERAESIRSSISRQFGEEFPEFAKSNSTADGADKVSKNE
jgi:hypothetical protein